MSDDPKRNQTGPGSASVSATHPRGNPPSDDLSASTLPKSGRPGAQGEDFSTVPVPLVDPPSGPHDNTPPPLPPSPASAAVEVWFEEAPTRPSLLTDLAPSVVRGPDSSREVVSGELPETSAVLQQPADSAKNARMIFFLGTAVALVVGLIIGALLFRSRDKSGAAARGGEAVACALTVESDPAGAAVTLNGVNAGATPADVASAPCGAVALRLEKAGFSPWELNLTLTPSNKPRLSAALKPEP